MKTEKNSPDKHLITLLKKLDPALNSGKYVFYCMQHSDKIPPDILIMSFSEIEGKTVIISESKANEYQIPYRNTFSWITLSVQSALDTVGLTAAFSSALTNQGIPCNIVSGFYHDHLFVPYEQTEKAMHVLKSLMKKG